MALADATTKLDDLYDVVASYDGVLVAFSGGADSALVAAAASRTLGPRALAVTAVSPSLAPGELEEARAVAEAIGIRHLSVRTRETENPEYLANGLDRCYHCKSELYDTLGPIAESHGLAVIASGANTDDLGDFRPGLRAAAEREVRHPLVEAAFSKAEVRVASATLGLRTADKPASACLSSRFAFGVRISVEELSKVGQAERLLKDLGFRQCRVRVHGDLVRVEVETGDLPRLAEAVVREQVTSALRELGFRYVTMDLEGFRSGSMNP